MINRTVGTYSFNNLFLKQQSDRFASEDLHPVGIDFTHSSPEACPRDAWTILETTTAQDGSIADSPESASTILRTHPAMNFKPIEDLRRREALPHSPSIEGDEAPSPTKPPAHYFDIAGNWMRNPHLPEGRSIAVFQYPGEEQAQTHWDLFSEHKLFIIDLTGPDDHQNLLHIPTTAEQFKELENSSGWRSPFYPTKGINPNLEFKDADGTPSLRVYHHGQSGNIQECMVEKPKEPELARDVKRKCVVSVLHYPHWPDRGTISIGELDKLVDQVLVHQSVGVHCVGGIGRSGTLITAAFIKEMILNRRIKKEEFTLEWLNAFLYQLRRQRAKSWVNNYCQYLLLYDYGRFLFENETPTGKIKA